jgi:alpha-beta hydrolase superfamily lysophospholipase
MLTLSAADGTRLTLALFEAATPTAQGLLIAPGFGQRSGTETMRFMAGLLSPVAEVAVLDFRGTGDSGGLYNFGADESQDVQAALAWAQARWSRVDLLGLSLGGDISVNSVAEGPLRPRRLLAVSPPPDVEDVVLTLGIFTHPLDLLEGHGKAVAHGSVDPFFRWGWVFAPKPNAVASAARLTVPAHFLAGGGDQLVRAGRSRRIYDAAAGPKSWTLWPEGGHAEHMCLEDPPAFAAWVRQCLGEHPPEGAQP